MTEPRSAQDTPPSWQGIHHLALATRDLDATVRFYRDVLGMPVLLEVDLQGARRVRREMPEAIQVFLAPPTWDELERRLVGRGTEPPDVIDRRLAAARVELAAESEFDVSIDNHDVAAVCARLLDLLGLHA